MCIMGKQRFKVTNNRFRAIWSTTRLHHTYAENAKMDYCNFGKGLNMQLKNNLLKTELCKTDIPQMLEISEVVQEGKCQKSFFFNHSIDCKPGQFVMVWLPGVDEKPMAASYCNKKEFAFTSQSIGRFTNFLDKFKKGDKLGIRGPYGNSFSLKNNACIVAGGVGLSSVSTLIDSLKNPLVIYGARSKG